MPVSCHVCGRVTDDVYYRTPGSGLPSKRPLCADCYERGWERYWREVGLREKVVSREARRARGRGVVRRRAGQRPDERIE